MSLQGLLDIVDQQRRDSRLDQSVTLLIRVDTIPQHGGREASVAVRNDDRGLRAILTFGPGRDGGVEGDDRVVVERERNDQVNLSPVWEHC